MNVKDSNILLYSNSFFKKYQIFYSNNNTFLNIEKNDFLKQLTNKHIIIIKI